MKRLYRCLGPAALLSLVAASTAESSVVAHQSVTTRIAWTDCGKRLQCARVRVPLDWARPGVGTISLAVVRHLASRPGKGIGSLFVNYGGPGVAGVPAVKAGGAELDKLGQGRFDVVGWDPRGTGASTHVRCFPNIRAEARFWGRDWSTPTTRPESLRYLPKTAAFVKALATASATIGWPDRACSAAVWDRRHESRDWRDSGLLPRARRALPSHSDGHPPPRRRVTACVRERSRASASRLVDRCLSAWEGSSPPVANATPRFR